MLWMPSRNWYLIQMLAARRATHGPVIDASHFLDSHRTSMRIRWRMPWNLLRDHANCVMRVQRWYKWPGEECASMPECGVNKCRTDAHKRFYWPPVLERFTLAVKRAHTHTKQKAANTIYILQREQWWRTEANVTIFALCVASAVADKSRERQVSTAQIYESAQREVNKAKKKRIWKFMAASTAVEWAPVHCRHTNWFWCVPKMRWRWFKITGFGI